MDSLHRERWSLVRRIARLASPNGVAGGFMSNGEGWVVRSQTIPNPDYVPPEPSPKDVMRFWVEGDVLCAELRDGSTVRSGDESEERKTA